MLLRFYVSTNFNALLIPAHTDFTQIEYAALSFGIQ
jgi:hypothetical protein